jgi:hypothetical protein
MMYKNDENKTILKKAVEGAAKVVSVLKIKAFVALIGLLISSSTLAWYGGNVGLGFGGGGFYFGGGNWGGYGHGRYGYFYGGAPNVIINVPVQRYYPRHCEEVEVCDSDDECWLERYCD